jgi:SAM-dependent methyltransferase
MTLAMLHSPSADRNRDPILSVLSRHLTGSGLVLEVASGSGQHVVHFAGALSRYTFQPTDLNDAARATIDARIAEAGLGNVRPALELDATEEIWPATEADAILCINMVHISPWEATTGLMRGAGRALRPGGLLFLYGPYRRDGAHTAPSNAAFDESLRTRNPAWGVRDLEAVVEEAVANGLALGAIEPMPANNLSVLFRRSGAETAER